LAQANVSPTGTDDLRACMRLSVWLPSSSAGRGPPSRAAVASQCWAVLAVFSALTVEGRGASGGYNSAAAPAAAAPERAEADACGSSTREEGSLLLQLPPLVTPQQPLPPPSRAGPLNQSEPGSVPEPPKAFPAQSARPSGHWSVLQGLLHRVGLKGGQPAVDDYGQVGFRGGQPPIGDLTRGPLHPSGGKQAKIAAAKAAGDSVGQLIMLIVCSMLIQVILFGIVGQVYQESAMDVLPEVNHAKRGSDFSHWRTPLLMGFCLETTIGCWSCCFPCARWADSLQKVGVMSFWPALWLCAVGVLLTEATDGLFLVVVLAMLVYFRQRFRRTFKMASGTFVTVVGDFLSLALCLPCAVAQDARQVEEACAAGDAAVVPHWAVV